VHGEKVAGDMVVIPHGCSAWVRKAVEDVRVLGGLRGSRLDPLGVGFWFIRESLKRSDGLMFYSFMFNKGNILKKQLTAITIREDGGYVSLCPELDIASQADTIEKARENLREALELFFESASPTDIQIRLHEEIYIIRLEVAVG